MGALSTLQVKDIVREGPQQPGGMADAEPFVQEGPAQPHALAAWGAVLWDGPRSGAAQKAQQPAVCPHSCCCTLSCANGTAVSMLREIIPLLSTCGAVSGYWQGRITVNVSPTQEQVARRGCRIMSFRILTDPLDVTPDILL